MKRLRRVPQPRPALQVIPRLAPTPEPQPRCETPGHHRTWLLANYVAVSASTVTTTRWVVTRHTDRCWIAAPIHTPRTTDA